MGVVVAMSIYIYKGSSSHEYVVVIIINAYIYGGSSSYKYIYLWGQ
jgi:hypothetical protein